MSVKPGGYGGNRENARLSKYSQRSCRLLPRASSPWSKNSISMPFDTGVKAAGGLVTSF